MNRLRKFQHILNEGISQEDLANTLCHRIEMRYPDIYKKYDYDAMYNAVDDVASFHAGAEEIGSSDINIMIRQVFKRLEESEGIVEGIPFDQCPHCGGSIVHESQLEEKKDACYYKVKSRYKVWPSAYASGALVKCRKKGASNWGTGGKSNESVAEGSGFDKWANDRAASQLHKLKRDHSKDKKANPAPVQQDNNGDWEQRQIEKMKKYRSPEQGVAEGQLDEKWTKKYKDSINCSNPKGFSQKAHCAGKQKNESSIHEGIEQVDENLHKWFKEKWVRFGPDGKIRGACARGDDSEGKPKCLPQSKAHSLGKKGRASAASRKRREDPNPERSGKAINVATKKKSNEGIVEDQLDELKCWDGYKRVPGTAAGTPGSCKKIKEGDLNELSTDRLAKYKTASAADARAADKAGDFARGNKRFAGIVKATKKQFDNDTKPKKESAIMKGLVDENLGTPYPGTYEQEFGPFKRKGSERTMKLTTEGKKNVSRRT